MHDLVLVGVLHGRTHEAEQVQSFTRRQAVRRAVDIDRLPFDVLHDEIRQAVIGHASIEQVGDVRMIEAGQIRRSLGKR